MGSGASKTKERRNSSSLDARDKRILLKTLGGHTGGINCMDISANDNLLLTGSDDRTGRVWDLMTFECKVVLEGHGGYISCCKIWQDRFGLTGSFDRSIRKWNLISGNCVMKFEHHKGIVNRMLTYGDFAFTTAYDGTAVCWHVKDGEPLRVFRGHAKSVLPLVYIEGDDHDPLGRTDLNRNKDSLITGSMDGTARMWNIASGMSLKTFKGHKGAILSLAVDMGNGMLFTGSTDHSIKKWNMRTGALLKSFRGHSASVICLQTHRRLLYSASIDATARCWVSEFGDTTRKFVGHDHMISDMLYHRGIVFTGSGDNSVKAFDAKSGTLKKTFKGHRQIVNCLLIHHDVLLSASYDGNVKVWNVRDLLKDKFAMSTETLSSQTSSTMSPTSANDLRRNSVLAEAAVAEQRESRENGDVSTPPPILHNPKTSQSVSTSRRTSAVPGQRPVPEARQQQARRSRWPNARRVVPEAAARNTNMSNNNDFDSVEHKPGRLDFDYINQQLQDLLTDEEYLAGSSTQSSLGDLQEVSTAVRNGSANSRGPTSASNGNSVIETGMKKSPSIDPSRNNRQRRPETRELAKRDSSNLLRKRPRTESSVYAGSRTYTPTMNGYSVALIDEDIKTVSAAETSSNTSGYRTAENNSITSSPDATPSRRASAAEPTSKGQKKSSVSFSPTISTSGSPAKNNSKNSVRRKETSDIRQKAKLKHQDSTISNGSVQRGMTLHERRQLEQEILDMV